MKALFASANAGTIGLIIFFVIFCGIVVWALRPKNKEHIESHKYIPLAEESDEHK